MGTCSCLCYCHPQGVAHKCHHNVQKLSPAQHKGRLCGKKAKLDGAWNTLQDVPAHGRMGFKVLSNLNQLRIQ